ncbi:hypothetical protein ACCC98_31990 [Rhizobium pisi]|uniref:hypothetical protein n=1 Tax=Rhizobium pisi TaxID=574561 RepID=UPI0039B00206
MAMKSSYTTPWDTILVSLAAHVTSSSLPGLDDELRKTHYPKMIRIWPFESEIAWPPQSVLTDQDIDKFAKAATIP